MTCGYLSGGSKKNRGKLFRQTKKFKKTKLSRSNVKKGGYLLNRSKSSHNRSRKHKH